MAKVDTQGAVRVDGLRELNRALNKAQVDAQDQKDLMHELGMIVVRAANVPTLTGALEGSLRAGKGKTKAVVRAGGARVPYAGVQHYGWPKRNIEPRPFLLAALESRTTEIVNTMEKGVGEILAKANLK